MPKNSTLLIIVNHPWLRLVSIYLSYYYVFHYEHYIEHGKYMLNTEEVDVSNEDGTAPQQQWRKPTFHGVYEYTVRV